MRVSKPAGDDAAASDLALLLDAARSAGAIAHGFWRDDPESWTKDDASPVSEADLRTNDALHAILGAARPDYGWLSEETPDDTVRLSAQHCFIVDPIDGTRAFLNGERNWALSLAVVRDGHVAAGVVHMPARSLTFQAALGQGAMVNGDPIAVSATADPENATLLAAKPTYAPANWVGDVPRFNRQFRSSLAYRVALVGQGRFDAMLTLRPVWEWDIAAGSLIATEAGALATDRQGAALRFNAPGAQTNGALAANPALHQAILAKLA